MFINTHYEHVLHFGREWYLIQTYPVHWYSRVHANNKKHLPNVIKAQNFIVIIPSSIGYCIGSSVALAAEHDLLILLSVL